MTGLARFQRSMELGLVLLLTACFIFGILFAFWRGRSLQLLILAYETSEG